jgi:hypothetical protein
VVELLDETFEGADAVLDAISALVWVVVLLDEVAGVPGFNS